MALIWWWISLVSCLIACCDWDILLFELICTQYWVGVCLLYLKVRLLCITCCMTQNTPLFSSTLNASLTQHFDFTVIAVLSKASWGHYMRLRCKSNPACSSTSQLANSAPLLQDSGDLWFYAKPPRSNGLCPNPRSRTWGVWSLSTNAEPAQSRIPLRMHRDRFDMHFSSAPVMQQRQESRSNFCIVNCV